MMELNNRTAGWVTVESEQVFTWFYQPEHAPIGFALLVPPIGHEAFHTHRFYKLLALHLQKEGFAVLRFDWPGCGNSEGDIESKTNFQHWPTIVSELAQLFSGGLPVSMIGLRLGANIFSALPAEAHVYLDPVLSPSRLVREIRVSAKVAEQNEAIEAGIESGGHIYSEAFLSWIGSTELSLQATEHTTVVTSQLKKTAKVFNGVKCQLIEEARLPEILLEPQFTEVPDNLLETITKHLVTTSPTQQPQGSNSHQLQAPTLITAEWEESQIIDKQGQFGILTKPKNTDESAPLLILVNSGSGVHVGPNRAYVELSRQLARQHQIQVLRLDLQNLGDSYAVGVPEENVCYPDLAADYALSFLDTVEKHKISHYVALAGICSGAHHAFHTAIKGHRALNEVILINPLTFYWHHGMSLMTPDEQKVTVDSNYYANKIKDPKAWLHLLKGKANIAYIGQFLTKLVVKKLKSTTTAFKRLLKPIPPTRVNQDVQTIASHGIQLSIVVSDSDPGWGLLKDASQLSKAKFAKVFNVKMASVSQANHTFSTRRSRRELARIISEMVLHERQNSREKNAVLSWQLD